MAYIGNFPAEKYTTFSKQTFTPDGSTTSFTLDFSVANENDLELFINNVRQEPGSGKAYTATGLTLTISSAPGASDEMYAIFQGKAQQTVTPGSQTVTGSMLATDIAISTTGNITTTGDLTVDTNTLFVDSTNNEVGIGTSSPSTTLDVEGTGVPVEINSSNSNAYKIQFVDNGTVRGYIGSSSGTPFRFANESASELMRITSSGNVGIGTSSPSTILDIQGADSASSRINVLRTGGSDVGAQLLSTGNIGAVAATNSGPFSFFTSELERMRIDSSGNVGIGTTSPSETFQVDFNPTQNGKVHTDVAGGNNAFTKWAIDSGTTSGVRAVLSFNNGGGESTSLYTGYDGTVANSFVIRTFSTSTPIYLSVNSVTRLTADSTGVSVNGQFRNSSVPAFLAYVSSDQTASSGNVIDFDSTYYNNGNHFSTTNNRFTAPEAGVYFFIASLLMDNSSSSNGDFRFYVNGSNTRVAGYADNYGGNYFIKSVGSFTVSLSANDYVDVRAQGSQVFYGDSNNYHSTLSGFRIG